MGLGAELPIAASSYPSVYSQTGKVKTGNASCLVTANYPLADSPFLPLVTLVLWLLSTQKLTSLLQNLGLPIPPVSSAM